VLLEEGLLTAQQLDAALAGQRSTGRMLGEMLVEQGVITASVLVQALARRLGVPGCELRHGLIDPTLLKLVGEEECERLKCMPMFRVKGTLTVAMAEPQSLPAIDRLRQLTGCKIRPVLALEHNIREFTRKKAG
jgi:type IV pilus assembly protein PilB